MLTPDSCLAVDDEGHRYTMDTTHSDWKSDTTLESGQRQFGTIVLKDELSPGTTSLDISFTGEVDYDYPRATSA